MPRKSFSTLQTRKSPRLSNIPTPNLKATEKLFKSLTRGKKRTEKQQPKKSEKSVGKYKAQYICAKSKYYSSVILDEETFKIGDHVYVNLTEDNLSDFDEESEYCVVCGDDGKGIMIECEQCLDGYHLHCLKPQLKGVPKGDWICPFCRKAEKVQHNKIDAKKLKKKTSREMFFNGNLGISRIEKIWLENGKTWWFEARWYNLPRDTIYAEEFKKRKREIFMSILTERLEMATIVKHCQVLPPLKYESASDHGDNIFSCTYEYNCDTKALRRILCDEMEGGYREIEEEMEDLSGEEDFKVYKDETESEGDLEGECDEGEDGVGRLERGKRKVDRLGANKRKWKRAIGIEFTSRLKKRSGVQVSDFEKAQAALGLSVVPTNLPCREKERGEIESCLSEAVREGSQSLGRCLYVSGVPGTGKTATVLEVMRGLTEKSKAGDLPQFRFVQINGLSLPTPHHVYSELYEALTGRHVGWRVALERLEEAFSGEGPEKTLTQMPLILLVDELDLLITKTQNVLYNLFDWPTRQNSRLTVIGIANTMDLPERLLPRIASRMGLRRCPFLPYSREQLAEIIQARLEGIPAFLPQAIKLVAMKVAAVSGDVRRALDICRRAAEVAEARHMVAFDGSSSQLAEPKRVELKDVDVAIKEMFDSPHLKMMARCSIFEKVFLVALVLEGRRSGLVETTLGKIFASFALLCKKIDRKHPNFDLVAMMSMRMSSLRLTLSEDGHRHALQKIQLNVPCDDVIFVLKKDSELEKIHHHLL